MKIQLKAAFGAALACLFSFTAMPALAHTHEAAFVWNDPGGNVLSYRLKTIKLRERGTRLEFHGRCSSACTIYPSLPSGQLCISRHVAFRFHAPYGANRKWDAIAADYMMSWYPEWVRSWILENGGLSRQIRTMNYHYASQHLRTCD
jgi:hypothetical protein